MHPQLYKERFDLYTLYRRLDLPWLTQFLCKTIPSLLPRSNQRWQWCCWPSPEVRTNTKGNKNEDDTNGDVGPLHHQEGQHQDQLLQSGPLLPHQLSCRRERSIRQRCFDIVATSLSRWPSILVDHGRLDTDNCIIVRHQNLKNSILRTEHLL